MMKRRIAASLIALVLLLTGCSAISSGVITDKKHSDAYYIPVSYCSMYNAKNVCIMYSIRYDYYPERWSFSLKEDDKTGWASVSESTWNSYNIGDYYGEK